jgi:hypothetical protein
MFAAVIDAGVAAGVGACVRCSGTRGAVGTARWGWRLGTAGGKESVFGSGLVVLRIVLLLQQQIGTRRQEGVGRDLGGDHGHGVTILGVEPAEEVQHLRRLLHRLPDVAQCVGQALEMPGVRRDVHVALNQASELCLEVDSAMKLLITELVVDRVLDGVRRRLGNAHNRTDILGDSVDHYPVWITTVCGGRGRSEVRSEAKLPDESIKEAPPLAVVRLCKIELNGNMVLDVDGLEHRGGERLDESLGERGTDDRGFGGRRGRLAVRQIGVGKRIHVHGVAEGRSSGKQFAASPSATMAGRRLREGRHRGK